MISMISIVISDNQNKNNEIIKDNERKLSLSVSLSLSLCYRNKYNKFLKIIRELFEMDSLWYNVHDSETQNLIHRFVRTIVDPIHCNRTDPCKLNKTRARTSTKSSQLRVRCFVCLSAIQKAAFVPRNPPLGEPAPLTAYRGCIHDFAQRLLGSFLCAISSRATVIIALRAWTSYLPNIFLLEGCLFCYGKCKV